MREEEGREEKEGRREGRGVRRRTEGEETKWENLGKEKKRKQVYGG